MNKAFKCSENLELFLNYLENLENQQKVSLSQTSGVISNFKTKKTKIILASIYMKLVIYFIKAWKEVKIFK